MDLEDYVVPLLLVNFTSIHTDCQLNLSELAEGKGGRGGGGQYGQAAACDCPFHVGENSWTMYSKYPQYRRNPTRRKRWWDQFTSQSVGGVGMEPFAWTWKMGNHMTS